MRDDHLFPTPQGGFRMLGVPRLLALIVLVALLVVVQGRETILPDGNVGGLVSELVHRCHGRAALETLLFDTEGAVAPLIVVVRENLPLLLPARLMPHPVLHKLEGFKLVCMHLELVPDMLATRVASQMRIAASNGISLGLIVSEVGPLSEVGVHACHVFHAHCGDLWLPRSFHNRPDVAPGPPIIFTLVYGLLNFFIEGIATLPVIRRVLMWELGSTAGEMQVHRVRVDRLACVGPHIDTLGMPTEVGGLWLRNQGVLELRQIGRIVLLQNNLHLLLPLQGCFS